MSLDAPLPDWSPTGDWIVSGGLLIAPDGKTERSIGSHQSPHYVFSKDGKRLYGLRPENGQQTLFSIDVASGMERTIAAGISFEPRSYLNPSIRLSLAPDGKSIIYGTGLRRYDLWMLEGFTTPDSLAARLGLAAAVAQPVLVGVNLSPPSHLPPLRAISL